MPLPTTRAELRDLVETQARKLETELADAERTLSANRVAQLPLTAETVGASRALKYPTLRRRLTAGVDLVLEMIDALDDDELLEVGLYDWAGKWPLARWISINTARQYTTARTMLRKALREVRDR